MRGDFAAFQFISYGRPDSSPYIALLCWPIHDFHLYPITRKKAASPHLDGGTEGGYQRVAILLDSKSFRTGEPVARPTLP